MMNIFSLTMQRGPDDIELLNKEIADYHLLNGFFPTLEFAEPDHRTAQEIYRWMESQITARPKQNIGGGPRKRKSCGSSKADETSDEDFTQRSRQQFKRRPNDCGSSNKAIVQEN